MPIVFDKDEILRTAELLHPEGELFEVRLIGNQKGTISSIFDSPKKMVDTLTDFQNNFRLRDQDFEGYILRNKVKNDVAAWGQYERFLFGAASVKDEDIERVQFILIDCDPERITGTSATKISSSDQEKEESRLRCLTVIEFLAGHGFPQPYIYADSGNGYHAHYRCDFPNDEPHNAAVKEFLETLDYLFSDDRVEIDVTVFNPSRMGKLYGFKTCKGSDLSADKCKQGQTPRPHRFSKILEVHKDAGLVSLDMLQNLVDTYGELQEPETESEPEPEAEKGSRVNCSFDPIHFMESHGHTFGSVKHTPRADIYPLDQCPFNEDHRSGDAKLFVFPNGAVAFKCHHNSCAGKKWQDVRRLYDPGYKAGRGWKEKLSGNTEDANQTISFGTFVPFCHGGTGNEKIKSFPVEVFPDEIMGYIKSVAEAFQVSVDMPSVVALGLLSLCCSGQWEVKIRQQWTEPTNLFCMVVANPSERKSPVLKELSDPLTAAVNAVNSDRSAGIKQYERQKDLLEGRVGVIKRELKNPKPKSNIDKLTAELELKESDLDSLKPIHRLRLIEDDVTVESLGVSLAKNDERMGIVSAEGGLFDTLAGRYSANGTSCIDLLLKAWSGESYHCNRITREEVDLNHPLLALCLMIQPIVLEKAMRNAEFMQKGLMARFLICKPESKIGRRKSDAEEIPQAVRIHWRNILNLLLPPSEEVKQLVFSAEARQEMIFFEQWIESVIVKEYDQCSAFIGKIAGCVARIAGLLHILDWADRNAQFNLTNEKAEDSEISAKTFLRAKDVGMFFIDHADWIYGESGLSADSEALFVKSIIKKIKSAIPGTKDAKGDNSQVKTDSAGNLYLTERDLKRMLHISDKPKPERESFELKLSDALDILTDHGYILQKTEPTAGRSSHRIYLNPDAFTEQVEAVQTEEPDFEIVDDEDMIPF